MSSANTCASANPEKQICIIPNGERNKAMCNSCEYRDKLQMPPPPLAPPPPMPRQAKPEAQQPVSIPPPQMPTHQTCFECEAKEKEISWQKAENEKLKAAIQKLGNKLSRFTKNQKGRQISDKMRKLLTKKERDTMVFLRGQGASFQRIADYYNVRIKDSKYHISGKSIQRIMSGEYDNK